MANELNQAASLADLPVGVMPEYAIVIVGYLSREGTSGLRFMTMGDWNLPQMLGTLQYAGHEIIRRVEDGEG